MVQRALKLEQVAPKEWKFVRLPQEEALDEEFDRAVELMEEGKYEEAEKLLRFIIEQCPYHMDAHHHLALLKWEQMDMMGALEEWGKAVEMGMASFPEDFVIGEDLLEWGWIENRPFLRAYHGLGILLFDAGRVDAAYLIFNQLLAMNPNDNQGVRALAVEGAFALGMPEDVLYICDTYKEDFLPDILYGRALALLQLGRKQEAGQALKKAISEFPLVAKELLKKKHQLPKGMDMPYLTTGGPDEAYDYWQRLGAYWKETEGALDFLKEIFTKKTSHEK